MFGEYRNKECHCGSKLKYKKCCYAKDMDKHMQQLILNSRKLETLKNLKEGKNGQTTR